MTPAGVKHEGRHRHEHHIGRVGRDVAQDGYKNDGRSQGAAGNKNQQFFEQHMDKAAALGHANAQSGHDGNAQRRKIHEILHHRHQKLDQFRPGEHVEHPDGFVCGGMPVIERNKRQQKRQHPDQYQGVNKQHGDVGQLVARAFHRVQKPVQPPDRGGNTIVHDTSGIAVNLKNSARRNMLPHNPARRLAKQETPHGRGLGPPLTGNGKLYL